MRRKVVDEEEGLIEEPSVQRMKKEGLKRWLEDPGGGNGSRARRVEFAKAVVGVGCTVR